MDEQFSGNLLVEAACSHAKNEFGSFEVDQMTTEKEFSFSSWQHCFFANAFIRRVTSCHVIQCCSSGANCFHTLYCSLTLSSVLILLGNLRNTKSCSAFLMRDSGLTNFTFISWQNNNKVVAHWHLSKHNTNCEACWVSDGCKFGCCPVLPFVHLLF